MSDDPSPWTLCRELPRRFLEWTEWSRSVTQLGWYLSFQILPSFSHSSDKMTLASTTHSQGLNPPVVIFTNSSIAFLLVSEFTAEGVLFDFNFHDCLAQYARQLPPTLRNIKKNNHMHGKYRYLFSSLRFVGIGYLSAHVSTDSHIASAAGRSYPTVLPSQPR